MIVVQTPRRSGNRIGIGRHVCNSMLRPMMKERTKFYDDVSDNASFVF